VRWLGELSAAASRVGVSGRAAMGLWAQDTEGLEFSDFFWILFYKKKYRTEA
jgi:hypothetical protein